MIIYKVPLYAGNLKIKKGLEKGPDAVIEAMKNFYLKEDGMLPFKDVKDVTIDNSDISASNDTILKTVDFPSIIIGGDHSMTYSAFKAFSKRYQNPGLLVFDAHFDMVNDFSPPTHEDYLRVLIEEKHIKKENVILVGTRNFHSNEIDFAKKNKLKIYSMKEISMEGKRKTADAVMTAARKFDALYISVDIDVLDPAFAPGTGYTEPGGMSTRMLLYFIHRLRNLKNIYAWDVVEVNPDLDVREITVMAAAKIVSEMC
jgi:agmatinase